MDCFDISDPLKGEAFRQMPNTMEDEVNAFIVSAEACPKRGLQNPLKKSERYIRYEEVCRKVCAEL